MTKFEIASENGFRRHPGPNSLSQTSNKSPKLRFTRRTYLRKSRSLTYLSRFGKPNLPIGTAEPGIEQDEKQEATLLGETYNESLLAYWSERAPKTLLGPAMDQTDDSTLALVSWP